VIDREWSPKKLGDIKEQVEKLKLQIRPDLTTDEIVRMQLEVLVFASGLTWPINQARFYEAKMARDKNRAYTSVFLSAEGSDRRRDADAKASSEVRVAEALAHEAEVYRKLLEDLKEDMLKLHYSLRATLKDHTDERKYA
jgi:flagellar biosynthesis regulator FlaF